MRVQVDTPDGGNGVIGEIIRGLKDAVLVTSMNPHGWDIDAPFMLQCDTGGRIVVRQPWDCLIEPRV